MSAQVPIAAYLILAAVLFFAGTTWLSGRSLGTGSDEFYKIQFRDAANLKASSMVRISGVAVGDPGRSTAGCRPCLPRRPVPWAGT